ncbi:Rossmann-fold NAD(P)-binding domain-containing protein [Flavobacterium ajazii]|uniref:hypothetical protein n=1 Tax=Flavobacterium ajazii TaxID=2692318 RepID=UPI001FECCA84|nr:hypothetical protein [Flavobacterium ajazii]
MKALVIGATGATGKDLVNVMLQDSDYKEIVLFVRRHSGIKHPKLTEVLTDFDKLEEVSSFINGDVFFFLFRNYAKSGGHKRKSAAY